MEVVITQWALDSYLDLKHQGVFSASEYKQTIRPDVLLLRSYPNDIKFTNNKFWSPATDGSFIHDGYKMKWHNIGSGRIQLRLSVGLFAEAILCQAYVKTNANVDRRELAKFKTRLQLIRQGRYTVCGRLT